MSHSPFRIFSRWLAVLVLPAATRAEPLTATDLIAQVVALNPERAYYAAEIAVAEAEGTRDTRWSDPELSVEYGRKRVHAAGGALAVEGNAWAVAITQTFDWPGRLKLRQALADQNLELAELGLARFERALAAEARRLIFGLHAAEAQARAVAEVSQRFRALRETLVAREPAGIAAELDLRVIEAADLELRRRATSADLTVQTALIDLNRLRGAPLDAPLQVTVTPPIWPATTPVLADLLSAALEGNFDFAVRRAELARQGLAVDLARLERLPPLSLTPFASTESADERETVIGLGLSLPLPVNGRAHATATAALARQRQADIALAVARRDLQRDLTVAAQTLAARLADLPPDPPAATARFRDAAALADRHYRQGAVPVSTYIELQHSYLEALATLYATQADTLDAALQLEALTGLTFIHASDPL